MHEPTNEETTTQAPPDATSSETGQAATLISDEEVEHFRALARANPYSRLLRQPKVELTAIDIRELRAAERRREKRKARNRAHLQLAQSSTAALMPRLNT